MYAPKNIIKIGNYANDGEFIFEKSRLPYKGPYVTLFNSTHFSGVILNPLSKRIIRSKPSANGDNPSDDEIKSRLKNELKSNLKQLSPASNNVLAHIFFNAPLNKDLYDENTINIIKDTKLLNDNLTSFSSNSDRIFYDTLVPTNITDIKIYKNIQAYKPQITNKDYTRGYINRYFCKKINEPYGSITEISEETYKKLNSKTSDYNFPIYQIVELRWKITDSEKFLETVKDINYKTISMKNKEMLNISVLLGGNLIQFSNTTK
jgi:hypothetical protein